MAISVMRRNAGKIIVSLFLAAGCDSEPKPLLPGLPLNVQSISFEKDHYTNSDMILANGTNAIPFELKFLDASGKEVKVINKPIEVSLNAETRLDPLYRSTTKDLCAKNLVPSFGGPNDALRATINRQLK